MSIPLRGSTTYSYDSAGHLTRVLYSTGNSDTYTYDPTGNIYAISTNIVNPGTNANVVSILSSTLSGNASSTNSITFTFSWITVPTLNYNVQYKDDLTESNWVNMIDSIAATGNVLSASDVILSTNKQRFYRVVLLP